MMVSCMYRHGKFCSIYIVNLGQTGVRTWARRCIYASTPPSGHDPTISSYAKSKVEKQHGSIEYLP